MVFVPALAGWQGTPHCSDAGCRDHRDHRPTPATRGAPQRCLRRGVAGCCLLRQTAAWRQELQFGSLLHPKSTSQLIPLTICFASSLARQEREALPDRPLSGGRERAADRDHGRGRVQRGTAERTRARKSPWQSTQGQHHWVRATGAQRCAQSPGSAARQGHSQGADRKLLGRMVGVHGSAPRARARECAAIGRLGSTRGGPHRRRRACMCDHARSRLFTA